MMIRKKSNPWARAKYLYVLPLAAVTVAAFARPEISKPLDEISSVKVNDLSAVLETYADKNVSNPAEKTKLKMKVVMRKENPSSRQLYLWRIRPTVPLPTKTAISRWKSAPTKASRWPTSV